MRLPNGLPNPTPFPFVHEYDGTQPDISDHERQAVAVKFSSLVSDTLLNFAGTTEHYCDVDEPDDPLFAPYDSVMIDMPGPIPDTFYRAVIYNRTEEYGVRDYPYSDRDHQSELSLSLLSSKSRSRIGSNHRYQLGDDGVVVRLDSGETTQPYHSEEALDIKDEVKDLPFEETINPILHLMEIKLDEERTVHRPNIELAQQMGLNKQPISLEEMEALAMFIRDEGFIAIPFRKI